MLAAISGVTKKCRIGPLATTCQCHSPPSGTWIDLFTLLGPGCFGILRSHVCGFKASLSVRDLRSTPISSPTETSRSSTSDGCWPLQVSTARSGSSRRREAKSNG
jgi:hypothetical protein